ncbi:MAG: hypothetical protein ACI9FW_000074 [Flavobacterium sp.]|jgi:hypothetical protein
MKTKSFITSILIITILFSCKKDEKSSEETIIEDTIKKNEFFSVNLKLQFPLNDSFVAYYTEDNTINFDENKAVWLEVKGSNEFQEITFNFKEEVIPTHLRLDFGINKDQKEVVLEKIKIDFYGNNFEIRGSDFLNYFNENKSIKTEIDQVNGSIKFIQNEDTFNPILFYPNEKLVEEIAKITK